VIAAGNSAAAEVLHRNVWVRGCIRSAPLSVAAHTFTAHQSVGKRIRTIGSRVGSTYF